MIHSSEIFLIGGTRRSIVASCLTTSKSSDRARRSSQLSLQTSPDEAILRLTRALARQAARGAMAEPLSTARRKGRKQICST